MSGSPRGEAPRLKTMPERVWYKSLYWRIALGYVALLAVLLLVQTGLSLWVMDRMWGGSSRTPEQLAELVAQDLSGAARAVAAVRRRAAPAHPIRHRLPAVRRHAARRHAHAVEPAERDPAQSRTRSARPPDGTVGRLATRRTAGRRARRTARRRARRRTAPPELGRGGPDGRRGGSSAQFAFVTVNEERAGVVAVPSRLPPLSVGLREAAPTLISVGIALLGLGAAIMALADLPSDAPASRAVSRTRRARSATDAPTCGPTNRAATK